jgi:type II secretory pathway component PulF
VARPVVSTIREQVANGMSFAEACAKSGVLDQVTVAIYRAAERSGDLAGAAKQLATSQRRTLLVSGRAQSLLIYPFVLMIVTTFVALVLLIGVLPTIGTRLMDMAEGVALPIYSRVLIGVGLFLREHIVIFLGLFAAVVVALVLARQQVRVWVLGMGRRLPIIRDVTLAAESARFFTVMSAMSKSGVPLAEGLVTANQVVSHPLLRKQLENLRAKLVAGGLLRQLIENVTAMPLATRRLLLAAERAGDLDNAFLTLAIDMTEEVEKGSARLLAFLQPALIVILSGVVGTLLMAILVPILTISSRIGGGG